MEVASAQWKSYPLQLALLYVANEHSGKSRTEQISSDVVRFLSDAELKNGVSIELTIDWPTPNDPQPLHLIVSGQITEDVGTMKTVRILRYEFRTQLPLKAFVTKAS
jgi:hypothetical protein